jgi:hypothetical protein
MNRYNLPDPLKGLIIENDFTPDPSIRALIKDNQEIFNDVITESHARFHPDNVRAALKGDVNTILVSSTFMYKDQLEDIVTFIESLNKPFFFIIEHAAAKMNSWIESSGSWIRNKSSFENYDGFIATIKKWVAEGRVFEIAKDYHNPIKVTDDLHGWYGNFSEQERDLRIINPVRYSEKYNMFYELPDGEEWCERNLKYTHN